MSISSISLPQQRFVQRVSSSEAVKKGGKFSHKVKRLRVRDVKKVAKQFKQNRFSIRTVQMTARNQRHAASQIHYYIMMGIYHPLDFIDKLPPFERLDEAHIFVLHSIYKSPHLYSEEVYKKLSCYFEQLATHLDSEHHLKINAKTVQQLMVKENSILNLMTLLNVCRQFERGQLRFKENISNDL